MGTLENIGRSGALRGSGRALADAAGELRKQQEKDAAGLAEAEAANRPVAIGEAQAGTIDPEVDPSTFDFTGAVEVGGALGAANIPVPDGEPGGRGAALPQGVAEATRQRMIEEKNQEVTKIEDIAQFTAMEDTPTAQNLALEFARQQGRTKIVGGFETMTAGDLQKVMGDIQASNAMKRDLNIAGVNDLQGKQSQLEAQLLEAKKPEEVQQIQANIEAVKEKKTSMLREIDQLTKAEAGKLAEPKAAVGRGDEISEVQSSEMLVGGLVQIVRKNGNIELVRPKEADKILIEQAEIRDAELQGLRAGEREEAKAASKMALDSFKKLSSLRKNINNMNDGIAALDDGAKSGIVEKRFPSIRAASLRLDNVQNQLGLDVIGNTTFGALSESELAFAIDTAMPTGLNEGELRKWLARKRDAQQKLMKYVEEATIYLGTPGNSIAGFLEERKGRGLETPPPQPPAPGQLQSGAIEDGHRFKGGDPSDPNNWEKI